MEPESVLVTKEVLAEELAKWDRFFPGVAEVAGHIFNQLKENPKTKQVKKMRVVVWIDLQYKVNMFSLRKAVALRADKIEMEIGFGLEIPSMIMRKEQLVLVVAGNETKAKDMIAKAMRKEPRNLEVLICGRRPTTEWMEFLEKAANGGKIYTSSTTPQVAIIEVLIQISKTRLRDRKAYDSIMPQKEDETAHPEVSYPVTIARPTNIGHQEPEAEQPSPLMLQLMKTMGHSIRASVAAMLESPSTPLKKCTRREEPLRLEPPTQRDEFRVDKLRAILESGSPLVQASPMDEPHETPRSTADKPDKKKGFHLEIRPDHKK